MNKLQIMLNAGYDVHFTITGEKSVYYVYLSHPKYGNDFNYAYGKTLDRAVERAFDLCIFYETHPE